MINDNLTAFLTPEFAREAIRQRRVHGDQLARYELVASGLTHADAIERLRAGARARRNGKTAQEENEVLDNDMELGL